MPDGNYQFYHQIVGWNYRRLAELHLLKEDRKEALHCLLYYRLKKLEGYFSGTGEAEEFRELKERLEEAVKEEPRLQYLPM